MHPPLVDAVNVFRWQLFTVDKAFPFELRLLLNFSYGYHCYLELNTGHREMLSQTCVEVRSATAIAVQL